MHIDIWKYCVKNFLLLVIYLVLQAPIQGPIQRGVMGDSLTILPLTNEPWSDYKM